MPDVKAKGMFVSAVHAIPDNSKVKGMFISVVHTETAPGGGGGDIQGSVIQSRKLQGDNLQGDT